MRRLTTGILLIALSVTGFVGCQRSSVIAIPPPAPARLFVSQFSVGAVNFVMQPFTPTSAVTSVPVPTGHPIGIAVDSRGNLFVSVANGFDMFAQPVTATSTPVNTAIAGASEPYGALIAQNGDLFITDANNNNISVFSAPATSPTLVQTTAIAQFNRPEGMSQDLGGRTFVAQEGNGTVVVLPPGFGAAPVPVAVLTLVAGSCPVGLANDVKDNLYVANTCSGNIDVYPPPFATSARTPAFSMPPPAGLDSPDFLVFDTSGTLYVAYENGAASTVAVFIPPFSGVTSASFVLPITDGTGIAFAP